MLNLVITNKRSHYWNLAASGETEPAAAIFYNDQSPDKIAYQAFALFKLNQPQEAVQRLNRLIVLCTATYA